MRSQIGTCRHSGEIMIDLLEAYEYVSRQRLAGLGARGDYPTHVIAASLATYGFKRRLVYTGYVSKELWPRRGITARSPFATGDLSLVCSDLMHQIFEQFPQVIFWVHVDDLSYSTDGEDQDTVVDILQQVHAQIQDGMRDQVELMMAHPKTSALASSEEMAVKLARAIGIPKGRGHVQEVGRRLPAVWGDRGRWPTKEYESL
jgi:hypothetical protein